jgi:hypothetical protein
MTAIRLTYADMVRAWPTSRGSGLPRPRTISVNNKAYAFAYDDANNQSSVQILGPSTPPTSLTLAIGW